MEEEELEQKRQTLHILAKEAVVAAEVAAKAKLEVDRKKSILQTLAEDSASVASRRTAEIQRKKKMLHDIAKDSASVASNRTTELQRKKDVLHTLAEESVSVAASRTAEKAEAERIRMEIELLDAERAAAEKREMERIAAEKAEAERVEMERIAAETAEAERVEMERIAAEKAEADMLEIERVAADKCGDSEVVEIEVQLREEPKQDLAEVSQYHIFFLLHEREIAIPSDAHQLTNAIDLSYNFINNNKGSERERGRCNGKEAAAKSGKDRRLDGGICARVLIRRRRSSEIQNKIGPKDQTVRFVSINL